MKPAVVLGLVGAAVAALFFVLFRTPAPDGPEPSGVETREVVEQPVPEARSTDITLNKPASTGRVEEAAVSAREEVTSLTGELIQGAFDNGLVGIVTDKTGAPVADAKLELVAGAGDMQFTILEALATADGAANNLPTWHASTGDDGSFRFTNLPPDQNFRLTATHNTFAETKKANFVIRESGFTEIVLVMAEGYALEGTVLDNLTGQPIEGAELRLQSVLSLMPGASTKGDQVAISDFDGTYRFENVTGGNRNLTVNADGYGSQTRLNLFFRGPLGEASDQNQDFRLDKALSLAGRVFAPDMTPIAGAKVEATSYETANVSRGSAVTNQNGAFEIDELSSGVFMVLVRAPGFSDHRVTRVELDDPELQIIMARQGGVMGSVVSGKSGQPVPAFRASVRMVAPASTVYGRAVQSAVFQDGTGNYSIEGLEAGSYAVQVEAEGFAPTYSETFVVNQGIVTPDVVVTMGQGGAITGRLVDANSGKPVARAVVRTYDNGFVENPFTQMVGNMIPRTTTDRTVQTDANGIFTIEALTATTYQIRLKHGDYTVEDIKDIIVREGETTDLGTIDLYAGATVRGTVYDVSGRPLPNARVQLAGNSMTPQSAVTDDDGKYVLTNIAAGTWKLSATRPMSEAESNPFVAIIDIRASEQTLSLADGQDVTRDLTVGG